MASHLGSYIRGRREAAGLRVVDVARLAGLGDKPKTLRHIEGLEKFGNARPEVFEMIAQALALDPDEVERALHRDIDDYEHWMDQPIPMELIVRVIPAFYLTRRVPADLSREQAIAWALEQAQKEPHFEMCLRLSRRERVWISKGGASHRIEQVQRGDDVAVPYMSIKGRRFRFVEPPKPPTG